MPIYEYRCNACDHELEALQKIADAPLSDCPACGESSLQKLVSAAAFQLKGSGWYETDFKNKKPAKQDGGTAGGQVGTGSDGGGSGDSAADSAAKKADNAGSGGASGTSKASES